MIASSDKEILAERVRAMARLVLTRRDDLRVVDGGHEFGLDYLVRIMKPGDSTARQFGVALRGTVAKMTAKHANTTLKKAVRELTAAPTFPFPVCLFCFTMANDAGFVTWIAEPQVDEVAKPTLAIREQPDFRPLDVVAVDDIVAAVNRWYDAFYATVARHTEGNGMNDGLKVWNRILKAEADYYAAHGEQPTTLKLPVRLASELAQLGPERLGDLSARILKDGIRTLENEQLFGMKVQLVRDAEEIAVE